MKTNHTPTKGQGKPELPESFRTITTRDVGSPFIQAFNRQWSVAEFIGRILYQDVGKRIYLRGDILQVENDEQRDTRKGQETPEVSVYRSAPPGLPPKEWHFPTPAKTAHTPGPWLIMPANPTTPLTVAQDAHYHKNWREVAHIFGDSRDERTANARLIAAAPELLAALKFALNQLELLAPPSSHERKLGWPAISDARAAIAKAEGRTE